MRGQRIEIYALASHMELRPTNTYSSLSHFLSLSERKRMQWQGKQGKKSKRGLGRKARTTSAFCERRPFVVATKPEEYPSFKCGTAAIEWPGYLFLESRAHIARIRIRMY